MVDNQKKSGRTRSVVIGVISLTLCCWVLLAIAAIRTNPEQITPPTYSLADNQTRRAEAIPTYRTMRPTATPTSIAESTPELDETAVTQAATITAVVTNTVDSDLAQLMGTVLGVSNRDVERVTSAAIVASQIISVEWTINDNFNDAAVAGGARFDIYNMLTAVDETQAGYQLINLVGTYPQVDEAGNTVETVVVHVAYSANVIDQIDWATFTYLDVYTIADILTMHPAFADG